MSFGFRGLTNYVLDLTVFFLHLLLIDTRLYSFVLLINTGPGLVKYQSPELQSVQLTSTLAW